MWTSAHWQLTELSRRVGSIVTDLENRDTRERKKTRGGEHEKVKLNKDTEREGGRKRADRKTRNKPYRREIKKQKTEEKTLHSGTPGLLFCRRGVSCRPYSHKTRLEGKGGGGSVSVSGARHCSSCRSSTGEGIVSQSQAGSLQVNLSHATTSTWFIGSWRPVVNTCKVHGEDIYLSVCLCYWCKSSDSLCAHDNCTRIIIRMPQVTEDQLCV